MPARTPEHRAEREEIRHRLRKRLQRRLLDRGAGLCNPRRRMEHFVAR